MKIKARPSRSRVGATSFDGEMSTSQGRGSQEFTSQGHVSLVAYEHDVHEAYKAHYKEHVVADVAPNNYPLGSRDALLLYLYLDHVARHVVEGEILCIYLCITIVIYLLNHDQCYIFYLSMSL